MRMILTLPRRRYLRVAPIWSSRSGRTSSERRMGPMLLRGRAIRDLQEGGLSNCSAVLIGRRDDSQANPDGEKRRHLHLAKLARGNPSRRTLSCEAGL